MTLNQPGLTSDKAGPRPGATLNSNPLNTHPRSTP